VVTAKRKKQKGATFEKNRVLMRIQTEDILNKINIKGIASLDFFICVFGINP
jgi:hypothetical protein